MMLIRSDLRNDSLMECIGFTKIFFYVSERIFSGRNNI